MIGLSLSGGGSRAIAFHLGCLRALNKLGLLDAVDVISAISGGSVIATYYAYHPELSFSQFEDNIVKMLLQGFEMAFKRKLLLPVNVLSCASASVVGFVNDLISFGFKSPCVLPHIPSRSDIFYGVLRDTVFGGLTLRSEMRRGKSLIVGASEMNQGVSFRFGSEFSGSSYHGELVENNVELALAVAASAAYPVLLPSIDRTWIFEKNGGVCKARVALSDGGIHDNLGLQVLTPDHDQENVPHLKSCSHIIACDAGRAVPLIRQMPLGYLRRVARSFEIVHRRSQTAVLHHLFGLKRFGAINTFSLSYLGQKDDRILVSVPNLITRDEVVGYPTDFSAMSFEWLDKLALRGEQLTSINVQTYMKQLLG